MIAGIVVGLGIAGLLYYIHKVGLPAVLQELKQGRVEVVAAINRHTSASKPNPIPMTTPPNP